MTPVPASRRSGPVPSEATTEAIRQAVVGELAERGCDQLSIEGVARRAGVGKAAIYRRHGSRDELVLDTVAHYATDAAAQEMWPDTGTFHGDVTAFIAASARYLADPVIGAITADLLARAARDGTFADALDTRVGGLRRARGLAAIRRAIARGELPKDCDSELATDLLGALIYWRLVIRRGRAGRAYQRRLVTVTIAAIAATANPDGADPSSR